jgi:hypothetical protein
MITAMKDPHARQTHTAMTQEAIEQRLLQGDEVILEESVVRRIFPGTLQLSSWGEIKAFCEERYTAQHRDQKTAKHHFVPRGF